MSPNMRKKLERNIQYHAAMAEYHGKQDAPEEAEASEEDSEKTASARPSRPSADEILCEMHTEVAKQLQSVLDAEPATPVIVSLSQNRTVTRNSGFDLKPSAGVYH
jgi:hypothetical protein